MNNEVVAYPLSWPAGWRRCAHRTRARFGKKVEHRDGNGELASWKRSEGLSVSEGTQRVLAALTAMGVSTYHVVISTNLALRNDGLPRSGQRAPDDPGAAVYWSKGKDRRCIAVDRYDRVQDNLAAIAATLEAMRAIDRHGGAEILDRAFTGFTALPQPEQWWQVLGVSSHATRAEIDAAYRVLAMKHHPDRGGDGDAMSRLNAVRDAGYEVTSGS